MALHINAERAERLAREVAKRTGETLTDAVANALEERLARLKVKSGASEQALLDDLMEISERSAAAFRSAGITKSSRELIDELYDDDGLPV